MGEDAQRAGRNAIGEQMRACVEDTLDAGDLTIAIDVQTYTCTAAHASADLEELSDLERQVNELCMDAARDECEVVMMDELEMYGGNRRHYRHEQNEAAAGRMQSSMVACVNG